MSRILVVDDDPTLLALAEALLEQRGMSVIVASDGGAALEAYRSGGVDLIVTDLVMPGCEGMELIRELRRLDLAVPILAVSGSGGLGPHSYLELAVTLGANDYLRKPFKPDAFLAKVAALLPETGADAAG